MESKNRQFIESFNPKLERLDSATNVELSLFYAGSGFDSFSKYIQIDEQTNRSEAMNDIDQGRGVTHLIYNYKSDGTQGSSYRFRSFYLPIGQFSGTILGN